MAGKYFFLETVVLWKTQIGSEGDQLSLAKGKCLESRLQRGISYSMFEEISEKAA